MEAITMAKKSAATAAVAAPKPNLFAKAKEQKADTPKKAKGTIFQLPKELDAEGKLMGDSAVLNYAVTEALEASQEEKTAKNKGNLAKGKLAKYAQGELVKTIAKLGVMPPTPVEVVNHNGESVTYVVQNKAGQNPISGEQIELLQQEFGAELCALMTEQRETYAFNPETMAEATPDGKNTVQDVVFEIVSAALVECKRLSDEQKANIIAATTKSFLRETTLPRVAELCGADANRIDKFFEFAGSTVVRYVKV
jgi:hypothetical protein